MFWVFTPQPVIKITDLFHCYITCINFSHYNSTCKIDATQRGFSLSEADEEWDEEWQKF